jgi:PTS system nitrogen regulatory IIA component
VSGFGELVPAGGALAGLAAADKAGLLAALARAAAGLTGLSETLILERVREREALGPTGFGQGAAIPHARVTGLPHVTAAVARLAAPVAYGALDGEPVDVAVLLLSPEGAGADHLKALARISRALRDPAFLARVRAAADDAQLRAAIDGAPSARAA